MHSKSYEVIKAQIDIDETNISIHVVNGRRSIGYFSDIDEAKNAIIKHKQDYPDQTLPYLIIHHDQTDNTRKIEYIEYPKYKLEKQKI